jgi:general secretion pathway protein E/type IV pilus assembly protein PilB
MTMSDHMTFEQASEFLNTSRSTLYRWVREGRVPGHKIGRQWRFRREELEAVLLGDSNDASTTLAKLAELLRQRRKEMNIMNWEAPGSVAENLIWDAVDSGAFVIHLTPMGDGHDVKYRGSEGLEQLVRLPTDAFEALDQAWTATSRQVQSADRRRMYVTRDVDGEDERVQVKYQRLETLSGPRITLRLLQESRFPADFDVIAGVPEDAATLRRWASKPHGLVLVTGRSGSGKTTTAYVCLNHVAAGGDNVVFTIEEEVGMYLHGVNQVEVNLDDERAYRDAFSAIFASDLDVLFIASTVAQRHRPTLWGTALSAAESGHLVFVQMEADSADDALKKFRDAVDRPFDDHLVGAVWQELHQREEGPGRRAEYDFVRGPLDSE